MSHELSFAPQFFLAEGEPYDRPDTALNSRGQPISVWSALEMMRDREPERFAEMVRDLFDWKLEPQHFPLESLLEKIEETNTCSNLTVPVEVWIDPNGDYMIEVYDCD